MIRRLALIALLVYPFGLQAKEPPLTVSGQWAYGNGQAQETDEGLWFCLVLDSDSSLKSALTRDHGDKVCLSNPESAAKLLGFSLVRQKDGCRSEAKGIATVVLSELELLEEDEMYSERIEAKLVSIENNRMDQPIQFECYDLITGVVINEETEAKPPVNFEDIRDAVSAHPILSKLVSAYTKFDLTRGLATFDASSSAFLPRDSTDTLVSFDDGNSAIHELTVERYDGRKWSDVSKLTLPDYINDLTLYRGTNYYLDDTGAQVLVRKINTNEAYRFSNRQFIPEN